MAGLSALIAAYHEADEPGGGLRATLPLAGRTLVERQARLAAWAGASPIVILVERIPSSLLAAIDRLRAEGLTIGLARSAQEAADAVESDDRLLLMADGLVAAEEHVERLVGLGAPSLLTVPDLRVDDRFERIDAEARWAGLALIDGEMLKRTASMLNDWDLQSTLLRRAVQQGARQLSLRGEPADDQLTVAENEADLGAMQERLIAGAAGGRDEWVSRWLLAPLEQVGMRLLMPTRATPGLLILIGAALMAMALGLFALHWPLTGLIFLLLATPLDGIAHRLSALRMQFETSAGWWEHLFDGLAAACFLSLSFGLVQPRGWGCVAIAIAGLAFLCALRIEQGGWELPRASFLAERKGMAWLLLPFAATGRWATGLAVLALYAAGSFFWAQRQVHKVLPARAPAPPGAEQD
ncbi:MAG: hypothetical protein E6G94_14295 [Alphaproteobacteria bacterium]|nr:MAG: hypothetical protein E6G94_14295 [Alphaproteobacteria bacterium]